MRVCPWSRFGLQTSVSLLNYNFEITQPAESTVSSFVNSSTQHRGMRLNLMAIENKDTPSQNLNQACHTLPECSN